MRGKRQQPVINLAHPSDGEAALLFRCWGKIALKGQETSHQEQNLFEASIPEAITVKTRTLRPGGVVMNNSCSFFLLATSCSASVCVGMFMHEAFIIEL